MLPEHHDRLPRQASDMRNRDRERYAARRPSARANPLGLAGQEGLKQGRDLHSRIKRPGNDQIARERVGGEASDHWFGVPSGAGLGEFGCYFGHDRSEPRGCNILVCHHNFARPLRAQTIELIGYAAHPLGGVVTNDLPAGGGQDDRLPVWTLDGDVETKSIRSFRNDPRATTILIIDEIRALVLLDRALRIQPGPEQAIFEDELVEEDSSLLGACDGFWARWIVEKFNTRSEWKIRSVHVAKYEAHIETLGSGACEANPRNPNSGGRPPLASDPTNRR